MATLAGNGTAAIRVAANQPIDLSGNATAAGQNQHFLEYSTYNGQNALVYNNAGGTVFRVADAKDWSYFNGPSSLGMYNCAGMTSGFPGSGSTMCWNITNGGQETDLITGQGGLNVYPVSGTGTISNTPNFTIQSNGNVGVAGTLAVAGTATMGGSLKAAGIPVSVQTGAYSLASGDCGHQGLGLWCDRRAHLHGAERAAGRLPDRHRAGDREPDHDRRGIGRDARDCVGLQRCAGRPVVACENRRDDRRRRGFAFLNWQCSKGSSFSEEKEAKTLFNRLDAFTSKVGHQRIEVLCFFLSRKNKPSCRSTFYSPYCAASAFAS